MTANEALDIGMKIAERHKVNVMEIIIEFGATPEKALNGCLVSLAADIMVALNRTPDATPGLAGDAERQGETD